MSVTASLCCFTVRQLGVEGVEAIVEILGDQFSDRSQRLNRVLLESSRKAWRSLEIALAGETLWSRFDRAEDRALREQLRQFVQDLPLPALDSRQDVRQRCLTELREARNKGLLLGPVVPADLAERAGKLARFSDPQALLQGEKQALAEMAGEIDRAGYRYLAWLLNQPAQANQSVAVAAVRFFFRRAVERDPQLFRGLQMTAVENLAQSQQASFDRLQGFLEQHEQRLEDALASATRQVVATVQAAQASIESRVDAVDERIGSLQQMQAEMLALLRKLDLQNQPLQPKHTMSMNSERDRQQLRHIEETYARIPAQQRAGHPELLSSLGKLQVAAGELDRAQTTFGQLVGLARNNQERAEAHHDAFRAALERGDNDGALRELLQASALDPARFALFPQDKYEALRILGAGGFGVTLLCQHRLSHGKVALKSLTVEDLERDAGTVLQEATALDQLKHRSIVSLRDCGYADAEHRRPYLVMEYFPGLTLEEHVRHNGVLKLDDAREVATAMAEALQAAHGRGILHRDIKPANLLILKDGDGWDVRVIDFGLALRHDVLNAAHSTARQGKTVIGNSIAGTLGFAAPEQMGKLPGVRVGPPADVFGFGRTLSYMLFGVSEPTLQHYRKLPEELADCLGRCLSHDPAERPQRFEEVLRILRQRPEKPAALPVPQLAPLAAVAIPEAEPVPVERSPRRRPARLHEEDPDDWDEEPRSRRRVPVTTNFLTRLGHALLAFLFGSFGAHKFAQGNSSAGMTRVLITCTCIGIYVTAVMGMIEAVIYLTKPNEQYHDDYIRGMKGWF